MQKKVVDKKLMLAIIISTVLFSIGLLGMNMEVQEDAWYIQSSVDGLFGEENISIFVLCSHFLFTGLLYLLSLTGVRLFWFNIILLILLLICNIINAYLIIMKNNDICSYVACICFLIFITPVTLLTYLNMTLVATYTVMTGGILSIYALNAEKMHRYVLGGGILLFIFGGTIRIDCLMFGVAFIGTYLCINVVYDFVKNKFSFVKTFKRDGKYIGFGCVILLLTVVLNASYRIGIEYKEPGFLEWNTMRANVTDHILPDYSIYEQQYKELGVSENDWRLFPTYNNCDTEIYSTEEYRKLDDLRKKATDNSLTVAGFLLSAKEVFKILSRNMTYWCCAGILFVIFLFSSTKKKLIGVGIMLVMYALSLYFYISGRFIDRIQASVFISSLVELMYLVDIDINITKKNTIRMVCIMGMIVFYSVPMVGTSYFTRDEGVSYFSLYKAAIESPDSFLSYLKGTSYEYFTFNPQISTQISDDNENLYFILVSQYWLSNYPMNVKNVFQTMPVGSSSNQAFLSSYMVDLTISKNICKQYGVSNPYKDIVNENVKVLLREDELDTLGRMLQTYEREHYYADCNYEVVSHIGDCVVLQFSKK